MRHKTEVEEKFATSRCRGGWNMHAVTGQPRRGGVGKGSEGPCPVLARFRMRRSLPTIHHGPNPRAFLTFHPMPITRRTTLPRFGLQTVRWNSGTAFATETRFSVRETHMKHRTRARSRPFTSSPGVSSIDSIATGSVQKEAKARTQIAALSTSGRTKVHSHQRRQHSTTDGKESRTD
ncbi:hypothetical protein ZHAS_00003243 [Anopheles sinensis]|uniref:Uncharacterized protein n=1 Tax=Anopheles sinensis TaxID=74873 RepID=A0A084VDX9_ANOSI|nr:hypothetical protein ZHAS_00003243 [Anopheles sinensis]